MSCKISEKKQTTKKPRKNKYKEVENLTKVESVNYRGQHDTFQYHETLKLRETLSK